MTSGFQDGFAARTIYGEARGESDEGKLAIAHVIRNRIKKVRWGDTAALVCLAAFQFSCWNDRDPNRRKMLGLPDDDPDLVRCMSAWLLSATGDDPTGGATHYRVIGYPANWANGLKPCASIGHHEFFSGVA